MLCCCSLHRLQTVPGRSASEKSTRSEVRQHRSPKVVELTVRPQTSMPRAEFDLVTTWMTMEELQGLLAQPWAGQLKAFSRLENNQKTALSRLELLRTIVTDTRDDLWYQLWTSSFATLSARLVLEGFFCGHVKEAFMTAEALPEQALVNLCTDSAERARSC